MVSTNHNIYVLETEVKPNKYGVFVLLATFVITAFSWIVNELGIFRVGALQMRIGASITMLITIIPVIMLLCNRKLFAWQKMKFIMMTSAVLFTFVINTLLTFHTTIMLLFPIFMAMLYRSRHVGTLAFVGSLISTIFSPIVSFLLGCWDVPFFQELILISTGVFPEITPVGELDLLFGIKEIILYVSMPRVLMVGACALLMYRVISVGVDHVNNQITLNTISHKDALTGLFNQNYCKELFSNNSFTGTVGVMFFDVNGLKKVNDSLGHEYGDLLLQKCASSLLYICDDTTHAFRLGGDEFLVIIENASDDLVKEKLHSWNDKLHSINEQNIKDYNGIICSMAVGYSIGDFNDIEDLMNIADSLMYENKAMMKNVSVDN